MRNHPSLWRLSAPVTTESEDAVRELLQTILHRPVSVYEDTRTGRAKATVYLESRHGCSPGQLSRIRAGLRLIRHLGLNIGQGRVSQARMRREDWAESWKRHFRPLTIGTVLLVKPSWSRRMPKRGQSTLVLDPGLSFGTGQHATTRYCLEELVRARIRRRASSLLDAGTGSGILALAAARLGYAPVHGFDNDPEAVRIALENARANSLQQTSLTLFRADLESPRIARLPRFDVVCANLMDDLLIRSVRILKSHLTPGGWLVVAGIPVARFPLVEQAFAKQGLEIIRSRIEKGWQSGTFTVAPVQT